MKRVFLLFLAVTLAGFGLAPVRADITASRYVGHDITPVDAPGIRMVSAKVDIDWGNPGNLIAVFVMNNETGKAEDVQLGFPVPLPEQLRKKHDFNFTMVFDGVPIDRASIHQDAPPKTRLTTTPREFGFTAATFSRRVRPPCVCGPSCLLLRPTIVHTGKF